MNKKFKKDPETRVTMTVPEHFIRDPVTVEGGEATDKVVDSQEKEIGSGMVMQIESETIVYKCKTCGKKFEKAAFALRHCRNKEQPWSCPKCGQLLAHTKNKARHIKACAKIKIKEASVSFKCEECNKIFTILHSFKRHKEEVHQLVTPKIHSCQENECNYTTNFEAQLKKHKTLYHSDKEERGTICNECDFVTYSVSGMKKHNNSVHNIAPRTCNLCREIFSSVTKMKTHLFMAHKKTSNSETPPVMKSVVVVSRKLGQHAQHRSVVGEQSGSEANVDISLLGDSEDNICDTLEKDLDVDSEETSLSVASLDNYSPSNVLDTNI